MSDITFKYKGVTKGTMDASGTATLSTAGLYSEADYVIEYQKPSIVVESDSEPYSFRVNAVDADSYTINKIIGGTVAWNQLCDVSKSENTVTKSGVTFTKMGNGSYRLNGTASATTSFIIYTAFPLIAGRKYFLIGYKKVGSNIGYFGFAGIKVDDGMGGIYQPSSTVNYNARIDVRSGDSFSNTLMYPMIIDLTSAFGSTIADYIYALEQTTTGAGVAYFRKLFPKPYYAYNAGELLSVQTSAHKMVGFNQWDEEWEVGGISATTGENTVGTATIRAKNKFRILPNTVYHLKCSAAIAARYYDANDNYIASYAVAIIANNNFTTPFEAAYMRFQVFAAYGTTYNHDICINLSGERDGEYEAYQERNYPLDSDLELRGILKLDANNNLYADGDRYLPDGTVERRYGIVDFGTLNWQKTSGKNHLFNTSVSLSTAAYGGSTTSVCHAICSNYVADKIQNTYSNEVDKTVSFTATGYCYIEDSAYSDAATFKAAMSGVYLVYELATPTTETATPYTNIGRIGKCYTESFIDYRTPSMPVGHNTEYLFLNKQVNTVGYSYIGANPVKVMDIPETETALSATGFNTWTPSTTVATIVNSSDAGTLALDLANYNYVVLWFYDISIAYNGTEENKTKILRQVQCMRHEIYKSPNGLAVLQQSNYNYNRYASTFISALADLYNSTPTHTIAYVQSVGVYPYMTVGTFSNSTSDTPTITLKTPSIRAVCNASYWSTANAGKVDKANSKFKLRGEVWRVDKLGVLGEMYKNIVDMYNA